MEEVETAAGVLLWRGTPGAPEFLLLRNARHGTWGFAKGHLEPGEELENGALRECREETGIELGADDLLPGFADASRYLTPRGRPKLVVMFLARRPAAGAAALSAEHDLAEWRSEASALEALGFEELRRCVVRAAERLRATAAAEAGA